jgi:hypothetical protein
MAFRTTTMRALNVSCGIAVLFTSLAYAHLLHRYFINVPHEAITTRFSCSLSQPLLLRGYFPSSVHFSS